MFLQSICSIFANNKLKRECSFFENSWPAPEDTISYYRILLFGGGNRVIVPFIDNLIQFNRNIIM